MQFYILLLVIIFFTKNLDGAENRPYRVIGKPEEYKRLITKALLPVAPDFIFEQHSISALCNTKAQPSSALIERVEWILQRYNINILHYLIEEPDHISASLYLPIHRNFKLFPILCLNSGGSLGLTAYKTLHEAAHFYNKDSYSDSPEKNYTIEFAADAYAFNKFIEREDFDFILEAIDFFIKTNHAESSNHPSSLRRALQALFMIQQHLKDRGIYCNSLKTEIEKRFAIIVPVHHHSNE